MYKISLTLLYIYSLLKILELFLSQNEIQVL